MEIPEFYRERSILVTGVTGFMGKVLLEKILRCCPGISRAYVLIRSKKKESAEERLAATLCSPLFEQVRKEKPYFATTVALVNGDVMLPQLGLDSKELNQVIQEVSIVFHCAATVKFNEPLQYALESNVGGVNNIIWLTKQMKKLETLVHLSTAYAHCYRKHIEEVVYPSNANPHELLQSFRWMSKDMIETITPFLLCDQPNSYTYTKALAENLLVSYQQNCTKVNQFPIAIIRPSIVLSSWREPMSGWIDSSNGPVGMVVTCGKGLLRTMVGKREMEANFIPVDFATNLMIAAAWRCVLLRQIKSDAGTLTVYNCTNVSSNPITWGNFSDITIENVWKFPLENPLRVPVYNSSISPNFYKNRIEWLYKHLIPAALGDIVLRILRKKPRYFLLITQVVQKDFFTVPMFGALYNEILEMGSRKCHATLLEHVQERSKDWKKYLEEYHLGIKKYILQEDLELTQKNKATLRRRKAIEDFVKLCFFLTLLLVMRGRVPALLLQFSSIALIFHYLFQLFLRF